MKAAAKSAQTINIAILAMGGEGGAVLADWIVDLAEEAGYHAQSTSVPGVAQRTGATIYYMELMPADKDAAMPVLALMPFPGDVDVVIASELMEAGRAVQRGLVTPERTALITSTHRVYAMTEKIAMGDGRADDTALMDSARAAARAFYAADFARAAQDHGSLISAVLFGALHASGCLPFERAAFEAAIRRAGIGVDASLAAFDQGVRLAKRAPSPTLAVPTAEVTLGERLARHSARVHKHFPEVAHDILLRGVARLADYQDLAYADEYLELLMPIRDLETRSGVGEGLLLRETARHLALWLSYEDTARVADLKIRRERFERVRDEVKVKEGQVLRIHEYLHPRLQEVADSLPAGLGRWLLRTGWARALVARMTGKGRVVRTTSLRGYLLLYLVASLRRLRRRSLRYHSERQRIGAWLARIREVAERDYDLAVAIAECQRLVKGYSDTHARGLANFDAIMAALPALQSMDEAGTRMRRLRDAALADEHGLALRAALTQMGVTS